MQFVGWVLTTFYLHKKPILAAFIRELCVCSVMSDSLWPHDCSPPDFSANGIFQARILDWVAISISILGS